jgi:hypothetical protein
MSEVVYTSRVRIVRERGPVTFSVHGAIAEHYRVNPSAIGESHAATIDYVVAAAAG